MDTKCKIPGCPKPRRVKGMCDTHYKRTLRKMKGAELKGPVKAADSRLDAVARFEKVAVTERTRAYFEKMAGLAGKRVSTYVGEVLDSMAPRRS